MKKIISILLMLAAFGSLNTGFVAEAATIASYTATFAEKQGVNGFYYCESKSGQVKELVYDVEDNGIKRWISSDGGSIYPMINQQDYATPGSSSDYEIMFVSPMRGTVRLQGTVERLHAYVGNSTFGDGVRLSILKNSRELWNGSIASNQESASYDVTASLAVGDKLHFVINCGQHNYYDATKWYPTVEYTSREYVRDEFDPVYYQKSGNDLKELEFSETADGYLADDNVAFICDSAVMPSDRFSVVKRYKIDTAGRYRVYAPVVSGSQTGFGNIVKISRNGEECWKQLLLPGKTSVLDIGIFAENGDYVDVEVGVNGHGGFNRCQWSCDVSKYLGKLIKECDTSAGEAYTVSREYTLSQFIKQAGTANVGVYSEKYAKVPMVYNSSLKKWESGVSGEKDYVTETKAGPGTTTDAIIEIKLPRAGTLKLGGTLGVDASSDGVLTKVYLNDRLIWSNRVGSEQSLRWDDKYDEVYFLNNINAMANVNSGDTLSFRFNKWRSDGADNVDISNVRLMYIDGTKLSETTKWKLRNSMVIDTKTNTLYNNGANNGVIDINVDNGTTYISKSDLEKVFGDKAAAVAAEYPNDTRVPLRSAAQSAGKTIFWAADRMIMIYDGISVFFSYPENGEIRTQLELGGDLFE